MSLKLEKFESIPAMRNSQFYITQQYACSSCPRQILTSRLN